MAGGIRKRSSRARNQRMSDINVTPFVDVMLVLLVIFMVTAPLLTSSISVNLPKSSGKPLAIKTKPITVTVNKNSDVFLQDSKISLSNLIAELDKKSKGNKQQKIYLRGDKDIDYGTVMQVMAKISENGYSKVALLTEMD